MKLHEKGRFKCTVQMVVGLVRFQQLVEALEQESPEIVERAKIAHTSTNMGRKVMVRFDRARTIQLVVKACQ